MGKTKIVLVTLALVAAACGGGADDAGGVASSTTSSPSATETPPTTEALPSAPGEEPSATTSKAPKATVDGPPAPDFTLALADGSTFDLSDEQKPVYLVFWAEW